MSDQDEAKQTLDEANQALSDFFPRPDVPVPSVNPADLNKMWDFMEQIRASHPGKNVCVGIRSLQSVCDDASVVWYRLSMLELIRIMSKHGAINVPWLTDGKPSQAVFSALAVVTMTGIGHGAPQQGFPLDLDELSKLIAEASNNG